MKGLKSIPSLRQISRAYEELQSKKELCLSYRKLSLYAQWSRLDPRLGELVIKYLLRNWKKLHPIELNSFLQKEVWPAVFGVILEHVFFYYEQKKMKADLFRKWSECVLHDIKPAKGELFFVDLCFPGSRLMQEEAFFSLKPYKKWGYLASDLMLNKFSASHKTLLDNVQRKEVLDKLLKKRKTFKVGDYLKELNFQISVKQAQRDLKKYPGISSSGNTKNKIYFKTI